VLTNDANRDIVLPVKVLWTVWLEKNVDQKTVDWLPSNDPPFVENELRAFVAFTLKTARELAVGAERYDRMLESIWPDMDDRIVLVWELVSWINDAEYPIMVELKTPVRDDVPVLRSVDTRVDVNAFVIGTMVLTVDTYTVLKNEL
jgi:hypothetical protein